MVQQLYNSPHSLNILQPTVSPSQRVMPQKLHDLLHCCAASLLSESFSALRFRKSVYLQLFGLFHQAFVALSNRGTLEQYKGLDGVLLIGLDGSQHFSSKQICCNNCSNQTHRGSTITYSHKAVLPVVVAPGIDRHRIPPSPCDRPEHLSIES